MTATTQEPDRTESGVPAASRATRFTWLAIVAFASGFPFGLVNEMLPVYLRSQGANLVDVGLITGATFPWTFKFLWSPLVDRIGSRRAWIASCLAGLAVLTALLGIAELGSLANIFWYLLVAMVVLSATQDIAIDAYTIEATTTRELGIANSVRIGAYRVAMFTAGGLLIWLAGRAGWNAAFQVGALMIALLAVASLFLPFAPRTETRAVPVWEPLKQLLLRRDVWAIALFALLFKLDISAMEPMTRPFWLDRGFSLGEIGAILTPGRIAATLGGAMLGGVLTTRWGIFRSLWILGAVQALSSLGYAWAAAAAPSKPLIIAVALFENFAAGLGTAAFVAFLMSVCERRYAATQYAVLSALLAASRALAGAASGSLAEHLGYAHYFFVTFLLGLPAFALLPKIRNAGTRE